MGMQPRPRSVASLVLFGGVLCAVSSQCFYGPLYLLGSFASGVSAQALLGVGLTACWAVGVIGVTWVIGPYRPRASVGWVCVIVAVLTATAAATSSPGLRVGLLCVGAAGGVVSSQTLNAVRHRAPDSRAGIATGRASALWFGLLAVVPFGLSWVIARAGVSAGLWALAGLSIISVGLVGLVIDRDPLTGGRVSWRAQVNIARERGARLVIVILVLSGGATVAGQSYGVIEAVRLGFAPKWLAPSVLLGVPAAALTPRFAERSQRQTMFVILALAAAAFVAGAGTGIVADSRQLRICGVITAFVLIQISAAAIWSAGQIIARPERAPREQHAEGAIRQAAPSAGQALIGLGLLPIWLVYGWSAICLTALALTTVSIGLLLLNNPRRGRHRRQRRWRTQRA